MLDMRIRQDIIVVSNQESPQHLPIDPILGIPFFWISIQPKKLHQMKSRDRGLQLLRELL